MMCFKKTDDVSVRHKYRRIAAAGRRPLGRLGAMAAAPFGKLLAAERRKWADQLERKTRALELELAKLTGAIVVLPPPPAKFPTVKSWKDGVHYEGDVVTFAGSTYQALRDTGKGPESADWVCLAVAGAGFAVRGKYLADEAYQRGDVVMMDGTSFVALKDAPSVCPGTDWRLLAMRGARGRQGLSGARGVMGMKGERGEAGPTVQYWRVAPESYTVIPIWADGTEGPALELRPLFERFLSETSHG